MHAGSLREDLLAIEGVEGADVDGVADAPSGLRIRIAEGADQQHVGREIRRVLSAHGLGTDTALPGEVDEPAPVMAAVSDGSSSANGGSAVTPPSATDADRRIIDLTEDDETITDDDRHEDEKADMIDADSGGDDDHAISAAPVGIENVTVEEGRSGIVVAVTATDGRLQREPARPSEGGVDRAVVLAATRLAAPDSADPIIVDVDERRMEGVDIVMIVLDCNGRMSAGSAVVGAGRAYALARAAWAAVVV